MASSYAQFGKKQISSFLQHLADKTEQSRAILLTGKAGWGKFSLGLQFAESILQTSPLESPDFFCFRNNFFRLKTEFFIKLYPNHLLTWKWMQFLQRRINMALVLEESLTLPSGITLKAIKNEIDDYVTTNSLPSTEKSLTRMLDTASSLDKKSGIPVNVIREAISFHSKRSSLGRVSIITEFDQADEITQNAALKILEEPFPNHWLLLTAVDEKKIIPTIASRTLHLSVKKPLPEELEYLAPNPYQFTSSIDLMNEYVFHTSDVKKNLINEFFVECTDVVKSGIRFIDFAEKLGKNHDTILFLDELNYCFEDALRTRQNYIRNIPIPLKFPQYQEYSSLFKHSTTAELEELVHQIENIKYQAQRSVIKDEALLPELFLNIARLLKKSKSK
ncbi:MAG: hypothetical protein ACRCTQ_04920 [Brevinemataceae bacterium]